MKNIFNFKEFIYENYIPLYKIGDTVRLYQNEDEYAPYKDMDLTIIDIIKDNQEDIFGNMYELIVKETGEDVPFMVYEHDLESIQRLIQINMQ